MLIGETMNIFTFLRLSENHRKLSNKVTQLVKHYDEVPDSRKKDEKVFGIQYKRDGVCALTVILENEVKIFS